MSPKEAKLLPPDPLNTTFGRREFLKLLTASQAARALPKTFDIFTQEARKEPMATIPKEQLGFNLHVRGIRHFKLPEAPTIEALFSLPVSRVRIPIPFDEVSPEKGVWDFDKRKRLIESAIERGLEIDLQVGMKTIGWPEVHIPSWLYNNPQYAYLKADGALLDAHPDVQNYTLEYEAKTAREIIIPYRKHIKTMQATNEPFSPRLSVSRGRHESAAFNKKQREVLRKEGNYQGPFVQNVPFDAWENIPTAINSADIIGFNIYNQNTKQFDNPLFRHGYWAGVNLVAAFARSLGKKIRITEFQIAPWLDENNNPISKFTLEGIVHGLENIQRIQPEEGIYLWDAEQVLAQGSDEHKQFLYGMAT